MAQSGRKQKHPNLRIVEGNPGHRRIPQVPEIPVYRPSMPAYLSAEAKQEWKKRIDILIEYGLINKTNVGMFEIYCAMWGEWKILYKNKKIDPTARARGLRGLATEVRRLANEFGMTPATIANMPLKDIKNDDSWGGLLD